MNTDNKFILILILVFLGLAGILSRIPQLNPPDMYTREVSLKRVLKLFFIALGVLIVTMVIGVSLLMYTSL